MGQRLTTGGVADPLLPRLLAAIRRAGQVDVAVAFIKSSGLHLLFDTLHDLVTGRGGQLRVLTSDYLGVTEPTALRKLMLLAERGADVRLFEAGNQSFHLKTYICVQTRNGCEVWGAAFIGSSNITRTALLDGIEWNYQVEMVQDSEGRLDTSLSQELHEIRTAFQSLFDYPQVLRLDYDWIDAYETNRKIRSLPIAPYTEKGEEPPATPNEIQNEALAALEATRAAGYRRGLVVMATGLGKTYLAAFDCARMQAQRILFVAHREEILLQAEVTFQRIYPHARVGRYTGGQKDRNVDLLFASIQTLGQTQHLATFEPRWFEYIVLDEFHHAAARTYRQLLQHFRARFLLGLTATPERTDQSDILSLCDDNLVYSRNLFDGIQLGLLCPFHYYGIYDETVDYQEIPWRNGRFDPEDLSNKLATLGRARHALAQWREKAEKRTLAFCVSIRHAEFMSERFRRAGIRAAAVYQGSQLLRSEALEQLENGELQIIFSVDLFNEGIDLPTIDTVMMLRPTESKVLFLQQLGRGLRHHPDKSHLVVLDFIGNHIGFLNKPQALFGVGSRYDQLVDFSRQVRDNSLNIPPRCYVNYDLAIIDFLARLQGKGPGNDYRALKESLGRRPTLTEFFRSGSNLKRMRRQHGQWWGLVHDQHDISSEEARCLDRHRDFLLETETTSMTKSFKAVLLESLLEINGFQKPPDIETLATSALEVFRRRRQLIKDLRSDLQDLDSVELRKWLDYWKKNPINAWTGGNLKKEDQRWFEIREGRFQPRFEVTSEESTTFEIMVLEIVDYRLAAYEPRLGAPAEIARTLNRRGRKDEATTIPATDNIVSFPQARVPPPDAKEIPFFPNLRVACGHFRNGRADAANTCYLAPGHGQVDRTRHFVARAFGDSMDGGKQPIHDGDYLLLELIDPSHAGSITGTTLVVERQDVGGDDQYLLRVVTKTRDGRYILKATNPEYPDYEATEDMRTLARLKAVLSPGELTFKGDTAGENRAD